ncbi:MAG: hypothetical protein U1E73_13520 [Planctomycetota bacterium]
MTLSLAATMLLAATAAAQMPMPAFNNTFTSTLTRGFFFQAPVGFTITGLQVYNEASQPNQVVEVIDFGTTQPPAYPGTVVGTSLFYDNATPSNQIIPCTVAITPGNWIGILGACNDFQGSGTSYNSYAVAGPYTSDILGNPVQIARMGTQTGLAASGPNQPCWTEAAFNIARVDVYVSGGSGFATKIPFGQGCNQSSASFYEYFLPSTTIDLSNTSFQMVPSAGGYVVLPSSASYAPPSATATNLNLGDDSEAPVNFATAFNYPGGSTNTLNVCSNGMISVASNGVSYQPSVPTFLGWASPAWIVWRDFICVVGGGNVWYEDAGGIVTITWNNVVGYTGTTQGTVPSSFNVVFDCNTGIVTFAFGSMDNVSLSTWTGGDGYIVGYSPGGPSRDPGSTDLTTGLPLVLSGADSSGLGLAADARPVLGTTLNLTVSNISTTAALSAVIYGLAKHDPGLPIPGAPGCSQYCSMDAVRLLFGNPTATTPFAVPNNTAFAGLHIICQGASYDPVGGVNALGAVASNGVDLGLDIN